MTLHVIACIYKMTPQNQVLFEPVSVILLRAHWCKCRNLGPTDIQEMKVDK